jgi:hypothetical protein
VPVRHPQRRHVVLAEVAGIGQHLSRPFLRHRLYLLRDSHEIRAIDRLVAQLHCYDDLRVNVHRDLAL